MTESQQQLFVMPESERKLGDAARIVDLMVAG